MTPEQSRQLEAVYGAVFNSQNPSILRDIHAMVGRGWNWHPADPDSGAFLKVKDIHGIAGALRDGIGGVTNASLSTFKVRLGKVASAAVKILGP